MTKKVLSGIQPSGDLTLGNYLGALKNWTKVQDEYSCSFFVADMHSITVSQDPVELNTRTKDVIAWYLASGIDPAKCSIFIQSQVGTHADLAWVLNCITGMGELNRMTQFKDKSLKQKRASVGLFDYPVLMAADILIYDADLVPVGEDQRQHLELTRTLANRFNERYGQTFKVPEAFMHESGARIMSLQDAKSKMSKSDPNKDGCIFLNDDIDTISKKINKSKTDSLGCVSYSDDQPEMKNLINILSILSESSVDDIVSDFNAKTYRQFKLALSEAVCTEISSVQSEYRRIIKDGIVEEVYKKGLAEAQKESSLKLGTVYEKIGFVRG